MTDKSLSRCFAILLSFLLVTSFVAVCVRPVRAAYDVTIWAWDSSHGWLVEEYAVRIFEGSTWTGFYTPHTFTGLTGTHFYQVPSVDPHGNPFIEWSNGATGMLEVSEGGTYTARYYELYSVTIWSFVINQGWVEGVSIYMDNQYTGYETAHEFTNLYGTHTFRVDAQYNHGLFKQWDTGETSNTITVTGGGTHTAQYINQFSASRSSRQAEPLQRGSPRPTRSLPTPTDTSETSVGAILETCRRDSAPTSTLHRPTLPANTIAQ